MGKSTISMAIFYVATWNYQRVQGFMAWSHVTCKDGIVEIPLERWDVDAYYDEDAEVRAVREKNRCDSNPQTSISLFFFGSGGTLQNMDIIIH